MIKGREIQINEYDETIGFEGKRLKRVTDLRRSGSSELNLQ